MELTPAHILGRFNQRISEEELTVEVALDLAWIFLRRPGFELLEFGDEPVRAAHLGKWMTEFPRHQVVEEGLRLLPLIDRGVCHLAKLSNIGNRRGDTAVIVVYCLDRDAAVERALVELGWRPTWKFNRQTFATDRT